MEIQRKYHLVNEDILLAASEGTTGILQYDVGTTIKETALFLILNIISASEISETPLVANDNVLTTRELVLGTTESLHDLLNVRILSTNREHNLTNVHAGNKTSGLAESLTHTGLETICACATQHFIDAENVEGVSTDTEMERILTNIFGHVLVDDDTSGFQSFG
jgi:hypothetical protein